MIRVFVLVVALVSIAAESQTPSRFAETCIHVLDFEGKDVRGPEVKAVELMATGKGEPSSSLCFTGSPGDAYGLRVYAPGHYPAYLVVEIGRLDRTRIVQLRPGIIESTTARIRGNLDCAQAACVVKVQQVDGEQQYTIDATNSTSFMLKGARPGRYAVSLLKSGRLVCVLPAEVGKSLGEELEINFAKCLSK